MKFLSLYNIIIESRLEDYKLQLKDDLLAKSIFNINDPKKLKMIIKFIKNKSIEYPKDMLIINKVYLIINRKQLDYNKFNNPQLILNQFSLLDLKINYNPDNEPCFTNKVELGNGVVVYNVQDDFLGLMATRKAVDFNWGKDAYPWCLITPPLKTKASKAFKYWNNYNAIQKRICFQNNKLMAFCANDKLEIQWWDRLDNRKTLKLIVGVEDDSKAILDMLNNMSEDDKKIYFSKYSNDPNLLLKLSKDKNYLVRLRVAGNPNTSIKILLKLANDKDYIVRCNVAENPNTLSNILLKLANDENYFVRCKVASNSNTPINILLKLAEDNDYFVRCKVAENLNCPIKILLKLANDNYYDVRKYVASNPNTPINILLKLSNDNNYIVKGIAKLKLNK